MSGHKAHRRNLVTMAVLAGVVAGMGGLAYAAVPLYRIFCQVTGYGGTTQVARAAPDRVLDRTVEVRFNSDVNAGLAWRFEPEQRSMRVHLGEQALAFFSATNNADHSVTGTAAFNVTPDKAGIYFNKIECFCFTEQTLAPGETARMAVTFYVDPALASDRSADDVDAITLSYTFFEKAKDDDNEQPDRPVKAAAVASGDEQRQKN